MFTIYLTTFCTWGPTASNCEDTVNRKLKGTFALWTEVNKENSQL